MTEVTKMADSNTSLYQNNSSSPDESIVQDKTATTVGALILTLVFLLGFPGNLFIIWSILAKARKHSVTTLLILNLAFADGSLMALTPFFIVYLVLKNWVFGEVMCKVLFYLCLANMYASIQLIMLMSIYRLVAVLWPRRVSIVTSRKIVLRLLAVVWVFVMIASIPAMIFRTVTHRERVSVCEPLHIIDSHVVLQYMMELVLGFVIPYGVIVVSYICILRRIRKTKFRRRVRSEKLILAIVLTFCLFWLPYHIINVVQAEYNMAQEPSCYLFHSLHQQLCQPSALHLRRKVLHPTRRTGVHGPLVRGHGAGLGHQEEPTEQPEQSRQRQRRRCRHAKGQRSGLQHPLEL
ncbi:leukotriene B4 receptor 1-like isoform X2 [Epinephelus fuscoguttatus]|uniref:leukotriene B4 receptor 1-like isoform X2 n=1 Tax=Epinephelus fuscoguttatus TaxID=293821 RepID=UPI0020D0DF77|nr:leukotriene B4 receptor 1-like isoform X2 [Epinephelus fuscoguttatus]